MNKVIKSEVVKALRKRDGYRCFFPKCNKPFTEDDPPTIDHWIPYSVSEDNSLENLRLMHFACNNKKGDKIPDEDGNIDLTRSTKVPKQPRPVMCETCHSGRLLLENEICPDCKSGPQPYMFPQTKKRKFSNCDHSNTHCWQCVLGFVERSPVINILITGDEGLTSES